MIVSVSQREVSQRKTRRLDSAGCLIVGQGRCRRSCGERRRQSVSPRRRGIRVPGSQGRRRSAAPSFRSRPAACSAWPWVGSGLPGGRSRYLAPRHGACWVLGASGRSRNHAVARRAPVSCLLHGTNAANHASSEHGCAELDGDNCGVQGSAISSPAIAQDGFL